MDKQQTPEEEQKDLIFDIFSKWREEPSTDRFLLYYQRLCKQIFLWCKGYLFRKIDNMGEEIAVVTKRIMESKEKIPSDKKSYFYYLYKALKAVEFLINEKRERTRGCYRALFTLHCIENYKNFEGLYHVLDKEVLEDWQKGGKEPNQYEIYQKYKPKVKQKSAEAMASTNLSKFLNDIETYCKEKTR